MSRCVRRLRALWLTPRSVHSIICASTAISDSWHKMWLIQPPYKAGLKRKDKNFSLWKKFRFT